MFAMLTEFTHSGKLNRVPELDSRLFYFITAVASIGESQLCSSHDIFVKHFKSSKEVAHTQLSLASDISVRYPEVGRGEHPKTPKHNSSGKIFYFSKLLFFRQLSHDF